VKLYHVNVICGQSVNIMSNSNNGLYRTGVPEVRAGHEHSRAFNLGTVAKKCVSRLTLPAGLTDQVILKHFNEICSGCDDNKATEVVPLVAGPLPKDVNGYTVLCGQCLCDWRGR